MPALFYIMIYIAATALTAYMIIALRGGGMKKSRNKAKTGTTKNVATTPPKSKLDWVELAKNRWEDGWILFTILILAVHFFAWYYFTEKYSFFFKGVWAIWFLQLALLVRTLFKELFAKHAGAKGAMAALLVLFGCATIATYFDKVRESDCTVKAPKCWEAEAAITKETVRIAHDIIVKENIASVRTAAYLPPINVDKACMQNGNEYEVSFVVQVKPGQQTGAIIPPSGCNITYDWTHTGSAFIVETKEHITDVASTLDTLIQGQPCKPVSRIRWLRLSAYDVQDSVKIHIFPISRSTACA